MTGWWSGYSGGGGGWFQTYRPHWQSSHWYHSMGSGVSHGPARMLPYDRFERVGGTLTALGVYLWHMPTLAPDTWEWLVAHVETIRVYVYTCMGV